MYKNANCSIKLQAGTSPRFDLNHRVRHGCPVSSYLFLICTQLLSDFSKLTLLKGITVAENEINISIRRDSSFSEQLLFIEMCTR